LGTVVVVGVAALVLLALWCSGLSAGDGRLGFRLDDAWIHMVYGREIASCGYPAYNPGIPATGSTAPLWAYWLALLHLAIGPGHVGALVIAVHLSNAVLWLGVVWWGMRLARSLRATHTIVLGTGLCLAFATPVAAAVYSGMEVVLCALLLLAGTQALLGERCGRAGLGFALACLTRPEAASCALLGGIWLYCFPGCADSKSQALGTGARMRRLFRYATPLVLIGAGLFAFHLLASGRPLPATFYLKAQVDRLGLPRTLYRLFADLLAQVPMLGATVLWLAPLSFLIRPSWPARGPTLLLLMLGLSYALSSVLVVPPIDPAAFYHLRYVLPAVPMLVISLFVASAEVVPARYPRLAGSVPAAICAATVLAGLFSTVAISRHLHSDTRNINQVQRQLGEWVNAHVPQGFWIATNDAGAIRYFSRRPTLDMMGLNTPRLLWEPETFARQHPVRVAVLMPAWFGVASTVPMRILTHALSEPYTVTSNPKMALQWVLEYGAAGSAPVPVSFLGARQVTLYMLPTWSGPSGPNEAATSTDPPPKPP
jgi:hypothetical protein